MNGLGKERDEIWSGDIERGGGWVYNIIKFKPDVFLRYWAGVTYEGSYRYAAD